MAFDHQLSQTHPAPVVGLHAIAKSFGPVQALRRAELTLYPGEVVALMGENGAGKSTLVKILAGMHAPTLGEIRIDGRTVTLSGPRAASGAGIAVVHQELLLFNELTVAENIFSGRPLRRPSGLLDWAGMRARARELLDDLDCPGLDVEARVGSLSVAMRQRVEIARALQQEARVLILDEPTAALGERDADRLLQIVDRLRQRGVAILYVSHRMAEIFRIADRMTVLRDGVHVGDLTASQTSEAELIALMVGREVEQVFPKTHVPLGPEVLTVRELTAGPLVQGASFTLRQGEILGVAGLVGAGRSELARAIFGLDPVTSGQIEVAGRPLQAGSPRRARDAGLALVPEDRGLQGLVKPMTIRENLTMAVLDRLKGRPLVGRGDERGRAQAAFARLGVLAHGIEQVVGELSGGNQQKVVLAKWLETMPRVLILDEPTRGVDVGAKAEIHALMGQMVAAGMAILMISSELPEVLALSDRVMVVAEGRIRAILPRAEATPEAVGRAMTVQGSPT